MNKLGTYLVVLGVFLLVGASLACHGGGQSAAQQGSKNATSTPQAGNEPTAAELAALTPDQRDILAASKGEKWHRTETIDPMDGKKTVRFHIWAKNKVAQQGAEAAPFLTVSCGKELLAYVTTGPIRDRNVRIRFDDGVVTTTRWRAPGDSLWPPSPNLFVKQLANAKTFKIEYAPLGGSPQVANFNTANLKELVLQEKLCKI